MNSFTSLIDLLCSLDLHVHPLEEDDLPMIQEAYSKWCDSPMPSLGYLGNQVFMLHGDQIVYIGPASGVESAAYRFKARKEAML